MLMPCWPLPVSAPELAPLAVVPVLAVPALAVPDVLVAPDAALPLVLPVVVVDPVVEPAPDVAWPLVDVAPDAPLVDVEPELGCVVPVPLLEDPELVELEPEFALLEPLPSDPEVVLLIVPVVLLHAIAASKTPQGTMRNGDRLFISGDVPFDETIRPAGRVGAPRERLGRAVHSLGKPDIF
jgi:hypothetical protein